MKRYQARKLDKFFTRIVNSIGAKVILHTEYEPKYFGVYRESENAIHLASIDRFSEKQVIAVFAHEFVHAYFKKYVKKSFCGEWLEREVNCIKLRASADLEIPAVIIEKMFTEEILHSTWIESSYEYFFTEEEFDEYAKKYEKEILEAFTFLTTKWNARFEEEYHG